MGDDKSPFDGQFDSVLDTPPTSDTDTHVYGEEVRGTFLRLCMAAELEAIYHPDLTPQQRVHRVVEGVLSIIDGKLEGFPQLYLAPVNEEDVCLITRDAVETVLPITYKASFAGGNLSERYLAMCNEAATRMMEE